MATVSLWSVGDLIGEVYGFCLPKEMRALAATRSSVRQVLCSHAKLILKGRKDLFLEEGLNVEQRVQLLVFGVLKGPVPMATRNLGCRYTRGDSPSCGITTRMAPDGSTLYVAASGGTVQVWNLSTTPATCSQTLGGHTCEVSSLSLAPDAKTLYAGFFDGSLTVWNLATTPITLRIGLLALRLGLHPISAMIPYHNKHSLLVRFDRAEDGLFSTFDLSTTPPTMLTQMWDGEGGGLVAGSVGSDDTERYFGWQRGLVYVEDFPSRRILDGNGRGEKSSIRGLVPTADDTCLYSASEAGKVIVWNLSTTSPTGHPLPPHVDWLPRTGYFLGFIKRNLGRLGSVTALSLAPGENRLRVVWEKRQGFTSEVFVTEYATRYALPEARIRAVADKVLGSWEAGIKTLPSFVQQRVFEKMRPLHNHPPIL